jgi:hypothetical protein
MFENPSKAFFNISNEAKKQGGWNEKADDGTLFCILAGPYAGTYIFGRPNVTYLPEFESRLNRWGRARPLFLWREQKLNERLKDLPAFISTQPDYQDHGNITEPALRMKLMNAKEELAERELWDREEYEVSADQLTAQLRRVIAGCEQEIAAVQSDPYGVKDTTSAPSRLAQKIYLLSQVGGVDYDSVIAAIKAQPKRLRTFSAALSFPGRREERARWARELLTSYSVDKAIKAWFPRVESISFIRDMLDQQKPADVRYALAAVPSWLQIAETIGRHAMEEDRERTPELLLAAYVAGESEAGQFFPPMTPAATRRAGSVHILEQAARFRKARVPAKAFHDIMKRFTRPEMNFISDTLLMAQNPDAREVLAETNEGRRVLQHIMDMDWREVIRDHDRVVEAHRTGILRRYDGLNAEQSADDAALTRFHSRSAAFNIPPGVRPLRTKGEFIVEGEDMKHCVAGYFYQRRSWCFAFQAEDGKRATLELGKNGTVNQFYGIQNSSPSASVNKLLTEFKRLNHDNIAKMHKGEFPPKELVEIEVTNHPGEPPVQGNPFNRFRR